MADRQAGHRRRAQAASLIMMNKKPLIDTMHACLADSRFWRVIVLAYLTVLSFLSLNPWLRPKDSGGAFSPDKIDHAIAYAGLAIVIYLCLFPPRQPRAWVFAVAGATSTGILIEVAQSLFTTNRSGSVDDAVANAVGALLGFVLFRSAEYLHSRRGAA